MLNSKKYWLAFAALEKTGSVFVQKLFEHFSDIELAWKADISELIRIENISKKQLDNFLSEKEKISPDKCLEEIISRDLSFITFDDADYPELLRHIYNPPMTLFIAGDISSCNLDKTLAIVGSRKASESSKEILNKLIYDLAGTDICIISGLAAGIDTAAHNAAIKSGLKTIGVIGGGLNHIYPSSNRNLFRQIKEGSGAVISEYWPTFEPIAWRFPHRNRIVSGLSKGTLVAEAAIKSGALITAKLCLEQSRELMCIPGLISNPNTAGVYKLLKDGASLVTCADDVLNALNWEVKKTQKNINLDNNVQFTDEEKIVLDLILRDSLNIDELIVKTNLNIGDLMVILTNLEIRGLIKQTDGEKYVSLVVF